MNLIATDRFKSNMDLERKMNTKDEWCTEQGNPQCDAMLAV